MNQYAIFRCPQKPLHARERLIATDAFKTSASRIFAYLLELGEVVVLAQLFEVGHSLGVVEAVVVVDFTVTCQLAELFFLEYQTRKQREKELKAAISLR